MSVMEQGSIGPWVLGTIMGLLSLIGLFLASGAEDSGFYGFGLLCFVFGVGVIFSLIHRYVGR